MLRSLDRLIFSLQAPMHVFKAACTAAGCDASPAHFRTLHTTTFDPCVEEAPWPLIVWPRLKSNQSSQILLRMQRSCSAADCGEVGVARTLQQIDSFLCVR